MNRGDDGVCLRASTSADGLRRDAGEPADQKKRTAKTSCGFGETEKIRVVVC